MKEKITLSFMSFILIASLVIYPVYATSTSDLYNEKDEINAQKREVEEKKDAVDEQLSATMQEISKLDESISSVQEEIDNLNIQIDALEESIGEKEEELEKKQAEHDKNEDLMEDRLVVMYETGENTFLDMLFNSENIVEFISSYYTLSQITQCDKELLESIENEQKEIEETKKQLEEEKEELDSVKTERVTKNNLLKSQKAERETVASTLSAEEKALQSEIDNYNAQVAKIENQIQAALRAAQEQMDSSNGDGLNFDGSFIWPCDNRTITSGVKQRWGRWHKGIDIGARYAPVYASASGYAYTLTNPGGYGLYILIVHGDGWCTLYGHLDSYGVSYGQYVSQGQVIATSGNTGSSTGPHLHFEIRKASSLSSYFSTSFENPLNYLSGGWTSTAGAFTAS